MHTVASCFVGLSNSVRKTCPFAMIGDDSPDPTAVFQRTFWLGPNSTGGLPSPIPEEFGPLNCGHSAAPAKFDRTTVAATMIQEDRVMRLPSGELSPGMIVQNSLRILPEVWWRYVIMPQVGDCVQRVARQAQERGIPAA